MGHRVFGKEIKHVPRFYSVAIRNSFGSYRATLAIWFFPITCREARICLKGPLKGPFFLVSNFLADSYARMGRADNRTILRIVRLRNIRDPAVLELFISNPRGPCLIPPSGVFSYRRRELKIS